MKSLTAATAAVLLTVIAGTGCGQQSRGTATALPSVLASAGCVMTGAVIFVVSGRQNSPGPALSGPMGCAAWHAILDGAPIGVVDLDGQPHQTLSTHFSDPGVNKSTLQQDEQNYFAELASKVQQTRAKYPHADMLDALDAAGRAIQAGGATNGTIYIEDSGLQETGPVNFRQLGMLEADPAEVIRFLTKEHELPDLTGVKVIFIGLGDTAPPQAPLSIAQRASLEAIWLGIAKAGGAVTQVNQTPRSGVAAPRGVPPVLPVDIPAEPSWKPGQPSYPLPDTGPVGFQPNLAVFRDPSAAEAALEPIARYLTANPSTRIELTGTTAHWGSLSGSRELSVQRADAVKVVLVRLGARAAQILTRGVAWQFPSYQNDRGPAGTLLPGPAEHNRSVIVSTLPENS
jgi:outer membrane protein OmpA-like peptidoglycan-associated protein